MVVNFIIHRIECAHCGIYFVHIDCKTESVPIVTLFRFDMLRQLYMTPSKQMKNVYLYKSWQMVLRLSCIHR